ncbi:hypothetical protein DYB32_000787 [Aphanomyces invadans]|uniref:Zinc finger PHD-type domain-containing protein n=1 Tax=Aphanomyces invadans TaxID=157072 RepID=A0A418B8U1_9STRA|nr:hypothetical protein DYB32_000787 [Aphanomyces invadans]
MAPTLWYPFFRHPSHGTHRRQGSLFGDDPAMSWNVNDLDSILRTWVDLPGITQAMLYFGMWSAMFALHTVRNSIAVTVHDTRARVCKCAPNNVTLDMDLFLTQLFTSSRPGSRAIAPDDWVLSCQCHKVATSADDVVDVDERWFECSTCSIWCHLRCRYPSLWEAQDHTLPATLLCHRCDVASCPPRKKHPPTIEMTPTKANESGGGNVLAKNAIVLIESDRRCVREVVAVDGKYIRVHFKGEPCASDEWMPSNSTTIVGIGPKTSPPQKQPTTRRRSRSSTPQKAKRHRVMPT